MVKVFSIWPRSKMPTAKSLILLYHASGYVPVDMYRWVLVSTIGYRWVPVGTDGGGWGHMGSPGVT